MRPLCNATQKLFVAAHSGVFDSKKWKKVKRGFQKQNLNGKPEFEDPQTICGLLEIALKGCGAVNHPVVVGSSRTDKGVHALCNTAHVDLDGDLRGIYSASIAKRVNLFFAYNDHDIRVLKVQQVADDFHCRFKVYERRYLYRLAIPKKGIPYFERRIIPAPITEVNRCFFLQDHHFDVEAVKSVCHLFVGFKDFKSFCSKNRSLLNPPETNREIYSLELTPGRPLLPLRSLTERYDFWDISCTARSFLYHQVRRIVSSLLAYGQGRITKADLERLFEEPGDESWRAIGSMVPADGLYLTDVLYQEKDLAFSEDLARDEIRAQKLSEEEGQIIEKLNMPETSILEKIELRKRLLRVKKGFLDS